MATGSKCEGDSRQTAGFGWSLSLSSITRKIDKGLPQYQDADESDVFILSGVEDLVPILDTNGDTLISLGALWAPKIGKYS